MVDENIESITKDLEEIKREIGSEPSKVDGTKGSGIKGILVEILERLDRIDQNMANLNKTPPLLSAAGIRKAGSWIAIGGLALLSAFQQCSSGISYLETKPAQAQTQSISK